MPTPISELEVLIATSRWLHTNGWSIETVSLAGGRGLPPITEQKATMTRQFEAAHIPFDERKLFRNSGPDIIASSGTHQWKVECKGISLAKATTHRNNFDRAVASVVSYYDSRQTRLGLALANDYLWEYRLERRLPVALREAIDMWVFLVTAEGAFAYEPTDDSLPFKGALSS
ncbi:MAG: hypothetical protein HYU30_06660 [Chloroflexi bacterium]|nr:hypothetical protein [Chloroflexota bacterium]